MVYERVTIQSLDGEKEKTFEVVHSYDERLRIHFRSHVAKEDVVYEIFKRVMNTGVAITGALIALLLSIIGYLLVNPVGLN